MPALDQIFFPARARFPTPSRARWPRRRTALACKRLVAGVRLTQIACYRASVLSRLASPAASAESHARNVVILGSADVAFGHTIQ